MTTIPGLYPELIQTGTGTPVVFLHSMAGSATSWAPQFDALSAEFRCYAWNMPGYGASEPAADSATMSAVVETLAAMLDHHGLTGPVHMVGLSVGGMIAQNFVLRHPSRVASLAILDSSARFGNGGGGSPSGWLQRTVAEIESQTLTSYCERMVSSIVAPGATTEVRRAALADMTPATKPGLRLAARLIAEHDLGQELKRIDSPTLVLVGEEDGETPVAYSETIAGLIAGARLEVVSGAGHLSNIEVPETVNQALLAHLREVAA
jgi:pimeloyl-ACP methyl ester carboxylesterase